MALELGHTSRHRGPSGPLYSTGRHHTADTHHIGPPSNVQAGGGRALAAGAPRQPPSLMMQEALFLLLPTQTRAEETVNPAAPRVSRRLWEVGGRADGRARQTAVQGVHRSGCSRRDEATSRFSFSSLPFILFSPHLVAPPPTPRRMRSAEFYKIAIQEESAVFN